MNMRILFFSALWIAVMAAAFLAGRSGRMTSAVSIPDARLAVPITTPSGSLNLTNPRASAVAFARSVTMLETNSEFRAAFEEFVPDLESDRTHDALFILADEWASRDPAAACAWLDSLEFKDTRNPFTFSALSQWAAKDHGAARAWLDRQHADSGATRDYLLAALIRGTSTTDPDAALRLLLDSPNSPERSGSVDFLVQAWQREGLDHALSRIAGLPLLKDRAIRRLIDSLEPQQLDSVKSWATSLADPQDQLAAHAAIAANLGRHDPAAAAEWTASIRQADIRRQAHAEVASRWARLDPPAAATWLASHQGDPDFDLAARAVAWNTVGLDPDKAFQQIATIQSEPLRDETFEQVGRIWISEQPALAKQFLQAPNPLPSTIREKLLLHFE